MLLMLATALVTRLMSARVGSTFLGYFGYIHLLSVLVAYTVPTAFLAARKGIIERPKASMIRLYVGAFLLAGNFSLVPGRFLHEWLLA